MYFILGTGGFWSILKINKIMSIEEDEDHRGVMALQKGIGLHSLYFSLYSENGWLVSSLLLRYSLTICCVAPDSLGCQELKVFDSFEIPR